LSNWKKYSIKFCSTTCVLLICLFGNLIFYLIGVLLILYKFKT